jgi:hypothetical protein
MTNKTDFDITEDRFRKLKIFTMHGATLRGLVGSQVQGDCPFCDKEGHFYVNWEKILWDCKVCGERGNAQSFLEKVNERNKKQINSKLIESLAEERSLPVKAFEWVELGYDRGQYSIAVRNQLKKLVDMRLYRVGSKVISTAGMQTGLFGLIELFKDKDGPIYICEGEWDTIAMQWLLDKLGKPGKAVCAPGANTFKPEWEDFFAGRDTIVCYDNDEAGLKGELLVLDRLAKKIKTIEFLHWPTGMSNGYDLRDFIKKHAISQKKPKTAFKTLVSWLKERPRSEISSETANILVGEKAPEIDPSVTLEDVFRIFEEHLHEPNRMGIEMCTIAALAPIFDTDPIWMFIVAPPSSGKTAIISGFRYLSQPFDKVALFLSHITTHSLVSGMETKRGDPSVFSILNGNKMAFFIKDFTTVVSMRDTDKEDIYAQLRDAYDGYTMKSFGNGVKREYNDLKFSMVAGVTEMIYDESVNFQALGERFAKLNISRGSDVEFSRNAIEKSIDTRDDFKTMEDKCAKTIYSCVKNLLRKAEEASFKLPKVNDQLKKAIIGISLYVSAMRGCVSRDKYHRDYIKSAPYSETGIRFAKMLASIAAVRAFIYGKEEATMDDLPLLRKIALDTINQRDEEIIRKIYLLNKQGLITPFKKNILEESRYTPYTVRCVLEDMCMLKIVVKVKTGRKHLYDVSQQMKEIIEEAKLYDNHEAIIRENPKVILKRGKKGEGRHSRIRLRLFKRK